jgi:hypothetical protein
LCKQLFVLKFEWLFLSSRGVTIKSRAKMNFCTMLVLGTFFSNWKYLQKLPHIFKKMKRIFL